MIYRFGCPSVIHGEFVAEWNLAFARIEGGGGMNDDVEPLSGLLVERNERISVQDIKRAANAAPQEQEKRSSVGHLLLGVVERVVKWSECDVRRTSKSESVFDGFRNAHELTANLRTGVNELPGAPACFAVLPLPMGVSPPPLMNLRYFVEAVKSWMEEVLSATSGCADAMSKTALLVDRR